MSKVYIFGHQRPDTDAVTAAITLSHLKRELGLDTEARVLGSLNDETKYVLDYFKVKEPKPLYDVRLQLKDINYHKNMFINGNSTIIEAYNYLLENNITGVPIVDDDKNYLGIVTLKDLAKEIISGDYNKLNSSYENIRKTLDGDKVLKFNDEINGDLLIASYNQTTFLNDVKLTNDNILLVGDRHQIHKYVIGKKIKLLIVTGSNDVLPDNIKLAKENKVNIIRTHHDTFTASKLIGLSNKVKNIIHRESITFRETDIYDDFVEETKKLKHNNYPIVSNTNKCLGLIRVTDIVEKNNKKVILVDHQEFEQSVPGIEQANIIEIVDHHKIGNVSTKNPINFRNMVVGSSNTIVHELYKENNVKIPKDIAGLMLSGILSDTLI